MIRYFLITLLATIFIASSTSDLLAAKKLSITQSNALHFGQIDVGNGGTIKSNGSTTGSVVSFGGYNNGKFSITGTKNKEVELFLNDDYPFLVRGSANAPVTYSIVQSPPYILANNGKLDINVIGTLNVVYGQSVGIYDGSYYIDVKYADGSGGDDGDNDDNDDNGDDDDNDD